MTDSSNTPDRILSIEQCLALNDRVVDMATGGGTTMITFDSGWTASTRWGRNAISAGNETQSTNLGIFRANQGTYAMSSTNALDQHTLQNVMRRTEYEATLMTFDPDEYPKRYEPRTPSEVHPISNPKIWFDSTYNLDATARAQVVVSVLKSIEARGLSATGFLQVNAQGASVISSTQNLRRYYTRTRAQFSITVRDVKRYASGWAGVDFNDWNRIDTVRLAEIAATKCEKSRDPVAVEPGRYVTILEPQAVCDLLGAAVRLNLFSRNLAELERTGPFFRTTPPYGIRIGERVIDERFSIMADPMDPDCGFLPFDWAGEPYLKTDWIRDGVLKNLFYDRGYGFLNLHRDWALPDSHAFRMQWSGPYTTIDEMIATTRRGMLVTRLNNLEVADVNSMTMTGNTRDGVWLIENGQVRKSVKNFRIYDSPMFMLNNVEQVSEPQRTFRPEAPAICPAIKVREFNLSGLMDAV